MLVEDVNDNAPTILVNALTPAGEAEIDEHLPIGSFVAHVQVTDHDTPANSAPVITHTHSHGLKWHTD